MFDSRTDPVMDRFIADLVEGAERNSRSNGGPGVNVLVSRDYAGREAKLANHAGLGAAFLGPVGAAMGADDGQRLRAVGGNMIGGAAGSLAGGGLGALLGLLAGNPAAGASIGSGLGGYAGSVYGASRGGEDNRSLLQRGADKLSAAAEEGCKAAAARFGIKEALIPMALGLAGSLAGGAGAKALGAKVAPGFMKGLGGTAVEMGGQMAGGAVANRMTGPQGP